MSCHGYFPTRYLYLPHRLKRVLLHYRAGCLSQTGHQPVERVQWLGGRDHSVLLRGMRADETVDGRGRSQTSPEEVDYTVVQVILTGNQPFK